MVLLLVHSLSVSPLTPTAFRLLTTVTDILYDCMHYALHHTKLPQYLAEMKKYHLAHHYKNYELGFGVTSESNAA